MKKIVFLDRDTLSPETVVRPPAFPHELIVHGRTAPDEVADRIADADIVISNKAPLRRESLAGARKLKLIAVAATGTDIIDLDCAAKQGIRVSNIRDYARHTVPEHTFALMLALRRSLVSYRQSVLQGRWQEVAQVCFFDHPIADLGGSTLGIIGNGTLGQAVGRIAEAFGMRLLIAGRKGTSDIKPGQTPFDEVLRRADVITLHCPLNAETRGIIGTREFALMEKKPILINTGRGGLVDELALEQALEKDQIAAAGFDVTDGEPPATDSPMMRIAARPNVILTPHVAWASREAVQALADQLIENIELFIAGTPRNVVG
ncbi:MULTISPECIES: D-2-hydroxyacid dehydrogenase [Alphaproteobacteria]|uniref:Glycerate dehydrogenase n=2 Tax=Alphaproteobacteria TaxID=28211 RepID=A0A512HL86_9HYPH|nr:MULTISPECIES: D-2-hydroxyacid dehydrogenase [Alphaproteobacteria]GEO86209.1 glycerate dehydrogenase [Ciceribacter naphthalenivorans]GLR21413.1 glycerate dehydrogenase [Ciceribacter naphthalenivorans]GLT04269.1 glycerate dehydrogenase [Sphingomonas psychrolutea]